jgi:type 1 fimbria pilin
MKIPVIAAPAAMLLLVLAGLGTPPTAPLQGAMLQQTTGGQCDFTMSVSPASATITSGQSVGFRVAMQNLGAGRMINVGIISVSPQTKYEPAFHQPAYDIWLPANGTGAAQIIESASDKTVKGTYTITVQGKDVTGGCGYGVTHSVTYTLTVT